MYSHLDLVCMNITTTTKRSWGENSWIFGSCSSNQTYESNQRYTEQCCQEKGDYKVVCKDRYGDGWHGGYVQIEDVKYCDDFSDGFEVVREMKKFKGK